MAIDFTAFTPLSALAGGALIYLTCNEVIPESHSHGHEVPATFGIVAGFVLMILLRALAAPVIQAWGWGFGPATVGTIIMSALLIWRHEANIRKLLAGQESKLGQKA